MEWKDVAGFEGKYKVSSDGDIYSVISGKNLNKTKSSTGYLHVQLYLNGKHPTLLVHKIVADAFLPKKTGCTEINHIDGNKENNAVRNLERVTKSENMRHAINHGLRSPSTMTGRTGKDNPNSKEILRYGLDGKYIDSWHGIAEASRNMGCSASSISSCLAGRKKSAAGFIWRYKEFDAPSPFIDIPKPKKRIYTGSRTWKQKNHRPMKKIQQLSKDGKLIKVWENYIELIETTGFDNGNIYKCIRGKAKSAYGYLWRYENG